MAKISVLKSILLGVMAAGGALLTAAVSFVDISKREEPPAPEPKEEEEDEQKGEPEEDETEEEN